MNCPGCSEEIYREELIDGACPLCGEQINEDSRKTERRKQKVNEILDMFEGDIEAVAMTAEPSETSRELTIESQPGILDKILPKKCSVCSRWHIRVGEKIYEVEIKGDSGTLTKKYICRLCS